MIGESPSDPTAAEGAMVSFIHQPTSLEPHAFPTAAKGPRIRSTNNRKSQEHFNGP